jgi:hydroxyacylglutathione hydrolase
MLFCGDTLFSAGCGRMFEGTPEALLDSLERLGGLPFDTRVYCGHEYTLSNLQFAKTVEPQNEEIDKYQAWCVAQRACHLPTLPSTIGLERHVNPFLRCGQPRVKESAARHAGRDLPTNVNVFATLRSWKDGFRG